MERYKGLVPFGNGIIPIDGIVAINKAFVLFNHKVIKEPPFYDCNIQDSSLILLQKESDDTVISITEMKNHFFLVNNNGEVIADSRKLPSDVEKYLEDLDSPFDYLN